MDAPCVDCGYPRKTCDCPRQMSRELLKPAGPILGPYPQADGYSFHPFDKMPGTGVTIVPNNYKPNLLPQGSAERKGIPITTGVFDYFPRALAYIAMVSKAGNDKHNPGEPLHWAREKSTDHADCIGRHLIERGTRDSEGFRHSGMMGWRSLANLELELEAAEKNGESW